MCDATSVLPALVAPTSHGVDEVGQVPLGNRLPLLLKEAQELLQGGRWLLAIPYTPVQHVPHMLDRVEVWAVGRPVHAVDVGLL